MAAAIKTLINKIDKPIRPYATMDFTGSTSYPALGEPVAPADFGFTTLDHILPGIAISGGFILDVVYDPANSSLRFYYPTGGATTAPSTAAAPLVTTGGASATAVNATTPAITPGGGKEVPTTMDISGFKVRILAFGV